MRGCAVTERQTTIVLRCVRGGLWDLGVIGVRADLSRVTVRRVILRELQRRLLTEQRADRLADLADPQD